MAWNPKYALLIATSTIITYLSGLLIARSNRVADEKKRMFQRKMWVALSFASNLSILFFFKYFDFAVVNINRVLSHVGIQAVQPAFDVLLPVGISFYTFQALSYTMDVYRGEIYAEKNLAKYALFVSFFPQLVAGPIERSKNLLVQINERHHFDYDNAKNGLLLMLWGFFQKLIIADRIAILVNSVFDNYTNYAGFQIVVAAVFFSVQIYCDFSAYSDIAQGAARVMGFRLMDNFRQPYFATSIQDFWRRWHISLSTWFRDYLYIPLGGNRCSALRKAFNLMFTFMASGLWHGASWNFIAWGGLHGAFQIIGDYSKPIRSKLYSRLKINTEAMSFKLGRTVTTFLLVDFAWIFFRAPSARSALAIVYRMFSAFNPWIFFDNSLFAMGLDSREYHIAVVAILLLFVVDYWRRKYDVFKELSAQNAVFRWLVYTMLTAAVLILGIYGTDYVQTQFIYFQF
jgi:D-alanyl-lipoteichoic acid acyltransferase DltB (MBOAT superfamily)